MKFTTKLRSKLLLETYQGHIHKADKVLDVGCGNGYMSKIIREKTGCKITGTDIESYLKVNIPFVLMKKETEIPLKNHTYDVAILNGVLHHITYEIQTKIIKECMRIARATLIFDDYPSFRSMMICYWLNKVHNPNMRITHSYRDTSDWERLFKQNNFKYLRLNVNKRIWYPLPHLAYKLFR